MRSRVMSRSELLADRRNPREPRPHPRRLQMRQIEIDVRVPRLLHLADDRPAHHVARGQLRPGIVLGHEAAAVAIDEVRPFAPHGLGDQVAAGAGDVEHRGMELHELHVAQLGPGAEGQRHAVAGGHLGIGRLAVDLAHAAAGQDRLLGPDQRLAVLAVPDQGAAAMAFVGQEVDGEGVLPDVEVRRLADPLDHRPHDLLAGGVAQGVGDAVAAVSALASQDQAVAGLVELGAPVDQLVDPLRALADDPLDHLAVAERPAGLERVGHVVLDAVLQGPARWRCRPGPARCWIATGRPW